MSHIIFRCVSKHPLLNSRTSKNTLFDIPKHFKTSFTKNFKRTPQNIFHDIPNRFKTAFYKTPNGLRIGSVGNNRLQMSVGWAGYLVDVSTSHGPAKVSCSDVLSHCDKGSPTPTGLRHQWEDGAGGEDFKDTFWDTFTYTFVNWMMAGSAKDRQIGG